MSITSSNNFAVNNSLTVSNNTVLGADTTSTLIINSKPTFNSDVTINSNINQLYNDLYTFKFNPYVNFNITNTNRNDIEVHQRLNNITQAPKYNAMVS